MKFGYLNFWTFYNFVAQKILDMYKIIQRYWKPTKSIWIIYYMHDGTVREMGRSNVSGGSPASTGGRCPRHCSHWVAWRIVWCGPWVPLGTAEGRTLGRSRLKVRSRAAWWGGRAWWWIGGLVPCNRLVRWSGWLRRGWVQLEWHWGSDLLLGRHRPLSEVGSVIL